MIKVASGRPLKLLKKLKAAQNAARIAADETRKEAEQKRAKEEKQREIKEKQRIIAEEKANTQGINILQLPPIAWKDERAGQPQAMAMTLVAMKEAFQVRSIREENY